MAKMFIHNPYRMSETNQSDTELFDTSEESEGVNSSISNTDDVNGNVTTDGEESDSLNLDESPVKENATSAQAQADKQVEAWIAKVVTGKADLSEIPHKWLRDKVETHLSALDKTPAITELIDKKFAEKYENDEFQTMKHELNSSKLTAGQKAELQAEFKENLDLGMPKHIALKKAIKAASVNLAPSTDELRKSMAVPTAGRPVRESGDIESFENLPKDPKERLKALEAIRKSQV